MYTCLIGQYRATAGNSRRQSTDRRPPTWEMQDRNCYDNLGRREEKPAKRLLVANDGGCRENVDGGGALALLKARGFGPAVKKRGCD